MQSNSEVISQAIQSLAASSFYDLAYFHQINVYAALAAPDSATKNARKRRVFLDTNSIRYAMAVVGSLPAIEDDLQVMLEFATQYLNGDCIVSSGHTILKQANQFYDRELLPNNEPGLFIFLACLKVLAFVIRNFPASPPLAVVEEAALIQNEELEPDDWTVSYTVSAACSPNLESDLDRRRVFWEWWLLEAVPLACRTFPETTP